MTSAAAEPAPREAQTVPGPVAAGGEPTSQPVRIEPGPDDIVYLTFDQPDRKVNVFTPEALNLLADLLQELARASDVSAVIVRSTKPDCFLAGADLESIAGVRTRAEATAASRLGQRVFADVETLRLPVIAAIDGVCLGGGTEFALACHYRLLSDRKATKIGLPEVQLGILPAWGGTQRLPQVVGIRRALDLILTGRTIDARKARAIGFADDIFPPELFADQVLAFTRKVVAEKRGPRRARPELPLADRLLERTALGRRIIWSRAHDQLFATTRGHYPAPAMALASVMTGIERGNRAGYALEARSAADLLTSSVSRNLIGIFFLTEAVKKARGVPPPAPEPLPVADLGVLGAGIMGGGIAHVATQASLPVRLRDIKHEAILTALSHLQELNQREVSRRRITRADAERRRAMIAPTLDYSGFRRTDLVIEAVVENLDVKRKVLAELEGQVRENCVIGSNTSSLSISAMASVLRRPERFLGIHFFNPVERMRLVEIVRGAATSDLAVVTAFDLAKRLGKVPVVVGDCPGFLVNRILMPYLGEAVILLEEGYTIEILDRAMLNFGMPMGPIELLDEVGLDVANHVSRILAAAYGDRVQTSPILERLVNSGRLGRKNGLGFYRYLSGKRRMDRDVLATIADLPPSISVPAGGKAAESADHAPSVAVNLQERLVLPMINEAARCLMEGIVSSPADIDLALVLGIGFPPFRGGLMRYADAIEVGAIVERLTALAAEGRPRYSPAPLLADMARQGRRFYPDR
jgi:3-hydroxyacyl-CoA dehydrogenase / enoyl-CoA hydratase / 3-hydroxybutyryl-CoA epimerase